MQVCLEETPLRQPETKPQRNKTIFEVTGNHSTIWSNIQMKMWTYIVIKADIYRSANPFTPTVFTFSRDKLKSSWSPPRMIFLPGFRLACSIGPEYPPDRNLYCLQHSLRISCCRWQTRHTSQGNYTNCALSVASAVDTNHLRALWILRKKKDNFLLLLLVFFFLYFNINYCVHYGWQHYLTKGYPVSFTKLPY